MIRELPTDREKALEAIAGGWTRQPTIAHPDCLCGRAWYSPVRYIDRGDGTAWVVRAPWPKTIPCPLHSGRR